MSPLALDLNLGASSSTPTCEKPRRVLRRPVSGKAGYIGGAAEALLYFGKTVGLSVWGCKEPHRASQSLILTHSTPQKFHIQQSWTNDAIFFLISGARTYLEGQYPGAQGINL